MRRSVSLRKLQKVFYFFVFHLPVLLTITTGEVINGDCTIKTWEGIQFNAADVATVKDFSTVSDTCRATGCCVKQYLDTVDIIYTDPHIVWDGKNFDCGGFICLFSSNDTIWKSAQKAPKKYDDITAITYKTGKTYDTCKWSIEVAQELVKCIPSIGKPVFLIRTHLKKFVLIRVDIQKQFNSYCSADLSWWLQNDGTCDFSSLLPNAVGSKKKELKNLSPEKKQILLLQNVLTLPEGKYFDYQGRHLSLTKITNKNQILIRVSASNKSLKIN